MVFAVLGVVTTLALAQYVQKTELLVSARRQAWSKCWGSKTRRMAMRTCSVCVSRVCHVTVQP